MRRMPLSLSYDPSSPLSLVLYVFVCYIMSDVSSGNPRNKTALKPGRSLMDWIRLTNSSTDLTGGGGLRDVTAEELARHNSREDAWLAIRGEKKVLILSIKELL